MPLTLTIRPPRQLWKHQADMLQDPRAKGGRLALFWEMRLGKSLTTIRWLQRRHAEEGIPLRVLLVAPLTPMLDWCDLLTQERRSWELAQGTLAKRSQIVNSDQDWTLITYGSARNTPGIFNRKDWTAIILDESTEIKNPKAQITRIINTAKHVPPFKVLLAGKPAPQHIWDLYSQMQWLNDGQWMGHRNFWSWRDKYTHQYGFETVCGPHNLGIIKKAAHAQAAFLTRHQAGLGNQKLKQTRCGDLSPAVKKLYRQIVESWEVPGVETKYSIVVSGWLRRLCGGFSPSGFLDSWKYREVVNLLVSDLAGESVVIWFAWSDELARCADILRKANQTYAVIEGTTSLAKREECVRLFRSRAKLVLLINVACGKFGLDLSVADTAVYFSNSDSYLMRAQSEDRIENLNKKTPLLYIDLVTRNTADEDVLENLADKRGNSALLAARIEQHRRAG